MGFRYVSIFSGVEAATLAWEPLGWEAVAFSEIEPFPCAVLAQRWPDVPNLGDITKINWKEKIDGPVDLVVGGSPCQSFSVAGKREGLKGASGLMFEYIRCVSELRPRWFVWENVPGALSSEGGAAFGQLLSEMDELGYGLAWRVLDAQFFGVAQRRRRLFLVGHLGDPTGPAEVLFEPDCLQGNPASSREKRKELASRTGRSARCAGFKFSAAPAANTVGYEEEQAGTLTADWHTPAVFPLQGNMVGRNDAAGPEGRGYGLPSDPAFTLNCVDRQASAGTVSRLVGKGGRSYCIDRATTPKASFECCHTLRRGGDGGSNDDAVVIENPSSCPSGKQNILCMTGTQEHGSVDVELAGCLTARMFKDAPVLGIPFVQNERNEVRIMGDGTIAGALAAQPGVKQQTYVCEMPHRSCYPINEQIATRGGKLGRGTGFGIDEDGDPAFTLLTNHPHMVATYGSGTDPQLVGPLGARDYKEVGNQYVNEGKVVAVNEASDKPAETMSARRLTPLECERLQGFPDEHTLIPWKGKPAAECPDGPRYKAIGNSMAVPVMRWIGERISAVERNGLRQ